MDFSKLTHQSTTIWYWETFVSAPERLGARWQSAERDAVTMALEHLVTSELPQRYHRCRDQRRGSSRWIFEQAHAKAALGWISCLVNILCTDSLYVLFHFIMLATRKAERWLIDISSICAHMYRHIFSLHDFTLSHWYRCLHQFVRVMSQPESGWENTIVEPSLSNTQV